MFSSLEPPIYMDFEKEIQLSCDEIISLEINRRGISRFYHDSYFTFKYNNSQYQLTRHRLTELPQLNIAPINQTSFVSIQSFREFEDKKQEPGFPPIYAMDAFPEDKLIGSGQVGQVHLVSLGMIPLALKLERFGHHNVRQGDTFTLKPSKANFMTVLTSPLSAEYMPDSFLLSFRYWESSKDIPHSECIAEIKGLAFIKELNQWGVLYEYIDGYSFDQFCFDLKTHPHSTRKSKIIDMSLQLAEALKLLDDAGQPHTDLLQPNILIRRSNHFPVLIDYGGRSTKEPHNVLSRQQFGERLTQLTQALDNNNSDLNQLAIDCQTNKTFDELSWEIILNRLTHIKLRLENSKVNIKYSECDIGMQILSGFIAVIGIASVAIAFIALNAATFGTTGLVVAAIGVGATLLGGIGLFKYAPETDNSFQRSSVLNGLTSVG